MNQPLGRFLLRLCVRKFISQSRKDAKKPRRRRFGLRFTDADFQMKGRYEFNCLLGIDGLANYWRQVVRAKSEKAAQESYNWPFRMRRLDSRI